MKNIGVIGAGTMGNGIAHAFAQKDFKVNLIDISADALKRALATIEKNLDRMVKKRENYKRRENNYFSQHNNSYRYTYGCARY